MTVLDVIEAVDCRLHNEVCEEAKIKWISDLDQKIQKDVIDTHEDNSGYRLTSEEPADWSTKYVNYYTVSDGFYSRITDENAPAWIENTYYEYVHQFPYTLDSEVIIADGYEEIYILYLLRQITLLNGDIEHSNNYLSEYNNLIYEWKKFYNREHLPKPVGKIRNYRYEG